jgi:hypothetical protein
MNNIDIRKYIKFVALALLLLLPMTVHAVEKAKVTARSPITMSLKKQQVLFVQGTTVHRAKSVSILSASNQTLRGFATKLSCKAPGKKRVRGSCNVKLTLTKAVPLGQYTLSLLDARRQVVATGKFVITAGAAAIAKAVTRKKQPAVAKKKVAKTAKLKGNISKKQALSTSKKGGAAKIVTTRKQQDVARQKPTVAAKLKSANGNKNAIVAKQKAGKNKGQTTLNLKRPDTPITVTTSDKKKAPRKKATRDVMQNTAEKKRKLREARKPRNLSKDLNSKLKKRTTDIPRARDLRARDKMPRTRIPGKGRIADQTGMLGSVDKPGKAEIPILGKGVITDRMVGQQGGIPGPGSTADVRNQSDPTGVIGSSFGLKGRGAGTNVHAEPGMAGRGPGKLSQQSDIVGDVAGAGGAVAGTVGVGATMGALPLSAIVGGGGAGAGAIAAAGGGVAAALGVGGLIGGATNWIAKKTSGMTLGDALFKLTHSEEEENAEAKKRGDQAKANREKQKKQAEEKKKREAEEKKKKEEEEKKKKEDEEDDEEDEEDDENDENDGTDGDGGSDDGTTPNPMNDDVGGKSDGRMPTDIGGGARLSLEGANSTPADPNSPPPDEEAQQQAVDRMKAKQGELVQFGSEGGSTGGNNAGTPPPAVPDIGQGPECLDDDPECIDSVVNQ